MHDLQVFKVAASQASCAAVTRIRSKSRQWQPYRQHRPGPSIPLSLSDASKNSNNCHCCTHSAVAFLLELASADVGSDLHSSSRKSFSHASGGVLSCHAAPVYGPFFSCPPDLSRVSLSTSSLHLTFASCYLRPGLLSYHRLLRRLPVFTYLTWCSLSLLLSRFVPPPLLCENASPLADPRAELPNPPRRVWKLVFELARDLSILETNKNP